jgi:hypothetical protein
MARSCKQTFFTQTVFDEDSWRYTAFMEPTVWRRNFQRLMDSFIDVDEYEQIKQEAIELTEWSLAA